MKISLRQIASITIPATYGGSHTHDMETIIPAILVQNGERFDAVFDPNTSAFGEVMRDENDKSPVSENNLLITGMTVGFLAALRDRKFLTMRE